MKTTKNAAQDVQGMECANVEKSTKSKKGAITIESYKDFLAIRKSGRLEYEQERYELKQVLQLVRGLYAKKQDVYNAINALGRLNKSLKDYTPADIKSAWKNKVVEDKQTLYYRDKACTKRKTKWSFSDVFNFLASEAPDYQAFLERKKRETKGFKSSKKSKSSKK